MAIWRIAKLRVGWMVAGCAPGVLTILTSSLFQSTTIAPELDPASPAAATVAAPVACWDANTTVVVASVSTTPAKAINDFFIVVPLSSMFVFCPQQISAGVTNGREDLVTAQVIGVECSRWAVPNH